MADIRLAISVDSAGAIRSIKTFNEEVEKTPASAKKADGAVSGLRKVFEDFQSGLSFGAGFAVAQKGFAMLVSGASAVAESFGKMMGLLLTYSDRMVTMSQRTGLAVSSLQVLNQMAKVSGTDVDALSKAVVKMEVGLNKGDEAFKKLGLSVAQLKAMSPDAAFAKVAQSIGMIEDPMQRASAAVAVFGKSGAELLPVFSSNMDQARQSAEDFGLVLSDKTLSSAEALGDAIDTMGLAFDAFLMRLAAVVAQSPALMEAIEQISTAIGGFSKSIDGNASALTKWIDYGLDLAADAIWTLLFAIEKAIAAFGIFGGSLGMITKAAADYSGLTGLIAKMKDFTEQTRLAMKAKSEWAAIDMGGKGVLLPGGSLPKQGGGGGSFDGGKVEIKVQELKVPSLPPGLWMDLFGGGSQGRFGTMQGGSRNYNLWSDSSKFLPPELAGNVHVGGADSLTKSSYSASQALQNLANIAATSSNRFAKAIAGIASGASGLLAGLQGAGKIGALGGLGKILGKLGTYGQIASSVLSIGSSLFGLFKKKPKEPPPEPPKVATAKAWADFTAEQQSKGAAGVLAGVSGIRVTSPEDMAAQASIAAQSFWAMFKQQGLVRAADAFKAVRDKMLETFKAAGASDEAINALLGGISTMVDLAGNEAFRGAADGANGFSQALASIANEQLPMTIDQFRAFEQQAVAGYEQMKQAAIDQGLSTEEAIKVALQGSAQYLQTLRDAASKYGIDLGKGTTDLLDLAGQSGIALATDSQERLIMSLDALTETLGGAPPRFEQAIANASGEVGARVGRGAESYTGRDVTENGIGESTADALNPRLEATAKAIVDGISAAFASMPAPQIYMDTGVLIGEIAEGIDRGIGSALSTSLEGNR